MPDNRNICLLGFSPESEARIKKLINSVPQGASVAWVAANHKGLNGVVINASFLPTPQIQKYISLVHCPIVCAYNSDDGASQARQHHFPALDLRDADNSGNATVWLNKLFGDSSTTAASGTAPAVAYHAPANAAPSSNTRELLDHIRRRDNMVIRATHERNTTWIKPREGLVYINYPREAVPGFDSWTWVATGNDDIPDNARKLQFDLWLFESLWQSNMDGRQDVDDQAYYRLTRFPQPLGRQGRTEALRLATCAQTHPVNIETLFEKTSYSYDRIRRFLFATLMAGQVQKLEHGSFVAGEQARRAYSPQEKAKVEQKRSLLQRLREKLGL